MKLMDLTNTNIRRFKAEDYIPDTLEQIHEELDGILDLKYLHPKRYAWNFFLDVFMPSNVDPWTHDSGRYARYQDTVRKIKYPSVLSSPLIYDFVRYSKSNTYKNLFNNTTKQMIDEALAISQHVLNNQKQLEAILYEPAIFKSQLFELLDTEDLSIAFIAYHMYTTIYINRGKDDESIRARIIVLWKEWVKQFIEAFNSLSKLLLSKHETYCIYSEEVQPLITASMNDSILFLERNQILPINRMYYNDTFYSHSSKVCNAITKYLVDLPMYKGNEYTLPIFWGYIVDLYNISGLEFMEYYWLYLVPKDNFRAYIKQIEKLNDFLKKDGVRRVSLSSLYDIYIKLGIIPELELKDLFERGIINNNDYEELLINENKWKTLTF